VNNTDKAPLKTKNGEYNKITRKYVNMSVQTMNSS